MRRRRVAAASAPSCYSSAVGQPAGFSTDRPADDLPLLLLALATRTWWALILVPVSGYFFAWISHAFIERNKPATFTHPLWSLISDYRMLWARITGSLDDELARAGVSGEGRA